MSSTNSGPSVTTTPNVVVQAVPAGSSSVPFDPSSVAITGGTINGNAVASISPPFVQSLKIGTFGDSTADVGTVKATATTLQDVCDVALGTGTTTVVRNNNKWSLQRFYPAARLYAVGGISGQTTTQMIAREALAASSTRRSIQDVVDCAPDLVILRGGSINDINGLTDPIAQATIDAIYARHMQIADTLCAAGMRVLDEGIAGFSVASVNLNAQIAAVAQLNSRIQAAIATRDPSRIRFLSPVGLTCDSTGLYLGNMSGDGTHLSAFGQYTLAQAEAVVMRQWFGTSQNYAYSGANLIGSYALMYSKTSSGIGNTPDGGYTWNTTNATRSNADVRQVNGRLWAECDYTPSTTGAGASMVLPGRFDTSGGAGTVAIPIVSGGQYGMEVTVSIATLDGSVIPNKTDVSIRQDIRNSGGGRLVIDNSSTTATVSNYTASRIEHQLVCPIWQSSDAAASLTSASSWLVNWSLPDTQALRLGVSAPRIVKLN